VTLYFHLALHKGDLRVKFSKADSLEVIVSHCESSVRFGGHSSLTFALSGFEINLVHKRRLGTLRFGNLEGKDGVNLWD